MASEAIERYLQRRLDLGDDGSAAGAARAERLPMTETLRASWLLSALNPLCAFAALSRSGIGSRDAVEHVCDGRAPGSNV